MFSKLKPKVPLSSHLDGSHFVDLIIAERIISGKEYYVKWANKNQCTWIPEAEATNYHRLVQLHNNHQRQFRQWKATLSNRTLQELCAWCTEKYTNHCVKLGLIYETFKQYSLHESFNDLELYFLYNFYLFLLWRIRAHQNQHGIVAEKDNYTLLQYKWLLKFAWKLACIENK